ncbi:GntR family transcriptional regulator [Gemmatimonadota bacterium]
MFVVLSRENPDPMYKQVCVQIKDAVGTGELSVNEKLPSIREMAKALNVSVITIRRAYLELENQGFIHSRPGMGSFVADVSREGLREEKLREIRRELDRLITDAARFGISIDEVTRLIKGREGNHNVGRSTSPSSEKVLSTIHAE